MKLIVDKVESEAEPFSSTESVHMGPLLGRIGESRVVLLGESTHGSAEFYDMRAKITKALIEQKGFNLVAIEADWPDAARVDRYIRGIEPRATSYRAFSRFPSWMWANKQFEALVSWLYRHNKDSACQVRLCGLDLYSLSSSIEAVLHYLERVDPGMAQLAKERYSCLFPWQKEPDLYGAYAKHSKSRACESQVVAMLCDLLKKELKYASYGLDQFIDAVQNARLVAGAEQYYRMIYRNSKASWNLRDQYMFDTLLHAMSSIGPDSKAIVWAHNSHIGDASATQMGDEGEHNIGQLCRRHFGKGAFSIGFGTAQGAVAAASSWGGSVEFMSINAPLDNSYEDLFQRISHECFALSLRYQEGRWDRHELQERRLQRAIGVIYSPSTERFSHYFTASLARQFDEYIWFKTTHPVSPLVKSEGNGSDTFPFGL